MMILTAIPGRVATRIFVGGVAALFVSAGPGHAEAGRQVLLPAGTVIPVRLDAPLNSKTAHAGDQFTATVRSGDGDAGMPEGTRIQGVVQEAVPAAGATAGVLDMDFRRILLPDGQAQTIEGTLISLGSRGVQRDGSGLLTATGDTRQDRLKWIGIGAASGAAISTLTHGKTFVDTLLGAGAGFLLHRIKKDNPGDVNLKPGTQFGVRLTQPLAFSLPEGKADVIFNDRRIAFGPAKPFLRDGTIFVPLDPMSRVAGFDYQYDPGQRLIQARSGALRLPVGSSTATLNGKESRLAGAAEIRDGVIYVPAQFVALATGGSAAMGAGGHTALLTTDKAPGTSLIGTYTATGPAADAPGMRLTLLLNPDKTCVLTTDYSGKGTIIEMGTWRSSGPLVTVALTSSSSAPENSLITFEWKSGALVPTPDARFPRLALKRV